MKPQQRYTSAELSRAITIERAIRSVTELRQTAISLEEELADLLQKTSPACRESAYNLVHYLAIRRHDLRELQRELIRLGLSSLGRMEAHVMASLDAVLGTLYRLDQRPIPSDLEQEAPITFAVGSALLAENAVAILGPSPKQHNTRVMVTIPSEAAHDPKIIYNLLAQGMNVMRINCAHDHPEAWEKMILNLRAAQRQLGKSCRISFDLAGPKLRTEQIEPGPELIKCKPTRNVLGQVIKPEKIYFTSQPHTLPDKNNVIPIQGNLLELAKVEDQIRLTDTRGSRRFLNVIEVNKTTCICESNKTTYLVSDTKLSLYRGKKLIAKDTVTQISPQPQAITLAEGDSLLIIQGEILGKSAVLDEQGNLIQPACIGCSLPEVFRDVKIGERIFFDDGKIAGIIREVFENRFRVEITSVVNGKDKLKSEKGINLPDTTLNLPALTEKDIQDLEFIAQFGDMVALSFVQQPEDIEQLITELKRAGGEHLGIILKIENQQAFDQLPRLLLTAMQHPPLAVMVARGDLGVELGFERLSEVQEEILWLCEAAHIPVIWATQVLESLAKGGMPSRAEVTDAAMGSRAECVMLNKGAYIDKALQFLCDVLGRMQAHQDKKTSMLRKLSISDL
ncbi:Plastidial pyruvate kinase 4, chloroplastic [Planktothrix tepida]|uniref:pyruvate kinase n=1 Tax=Planktothrix tepida PCC 9214 TaxID=671072 RepID=A0A1J1LGA6_9CYAN|nr:pyruvate kinase [Planktothrix tepida]CAD5931460.1 Plastidial pyruvate kinase 4, chloroplastic [Planktothrix tepida]CUR31607.1 Pyruvate kinase barrel domain protein [Planktothrix tepida PCC 9214]